MKGGSMEKIYRHAVLVSIIVLTLLLGVTSTSVFAKDSYFGIQAGAVLLNDADVTQQGFTLETSFDTGYLIGLTRSQFQSIQIRIVLQGNEVNEMSLQNLNLPVVTRHLLLQLIGIMSFKTSSVTPYLGVGWVFLKFQ
jgi:hypothetical protein